MRWSLPLSTGTNTARRTCVPTHMPTHTVPDLVNALLRDPQLVALLTPEQVAALRGALSPAGSRLDDARLAQYRGE